MLTTEVSRGLRLRTASPDIWPIKSRRPTLSTRWVMVWGKQEPMWPRTQSKWGACLTLVSSRAVMQPSVSAMMAPPVVTPPVFTLESISLERQSAERSSSTRPTLQLSQADSFSWMVLTLPQILFDHLEDILPRQSRHQVDTTEAQGEGLAVTRSLRVRDNSSRIISSSSL